MAQTVFEKTARTWGNSSERPQKNQRRGPARETWHYEIQVEPEQKRTLKAYMEQERIYYNHLVEGLSGMTRTSPELINSMSEKREKLFGEIAYHGFKVRGKVERITGWGQFDKEVPESLRQFDDILFGINKETGKRTLSGAFTLLMETAAEVGSIHPEMRRNMAIEMLRYHREQAKVRLQSKGTHWGQPDSEFKAPVFALDTCDINRKRHVQLTKALVEVGYDEEKGSSWVKTPYSTRFWINGIDATSIEGWNMILVHQQPGILPRPTTPWFIEFRTTLNTYQVKYMDVVLPNRGSAFQICKKSRSSL
jgi:hypothetical protein